MVNAEARKGRWYVATDLIMLDLSSDSSHVQSIDFNPGPVNVANTSLDIGTETEVKGIVSSSSPAKTWSTSRAQHSPCSAACAISTAKPPPAGA